MIKTSPKILPPKHHNRNPATAFLLRFDDICPTLNWRVWNKVEQLLIEYEIKPLLAVIPDNQDPELRIDPPTADFWDRIRACRDRGWTIALHGYQHLYVTKNMGLVGRRRLSAFAGLSADQQEEKIRLGVEILRREGLQTKVFIAPGQ